MKALVFGGAFSINLEQRAVPSPGKGQVLVQVVAVGICGSELEAFSGLSTKRKPPLVLGHEIVGRVEGRPHAFALNPVSSCGSCDDCANGLPNQCRHRVLLSLHADGGQADYLVVNESALVALPELADERQGALVEPLAIVVNALTDEAEVHGRRVAILGCGALGLMAVRLAKLWGAEVVAAKDLIPARMQSAINLGARSLDEDEGAAMGYDLVLDMVGSSVTRQAAATIASSGATVRLVGLHAAASEVNFGDIVSRQIKMQGVYAYSPEQFQTAASLVQAGVMELNEIVTYAPLADGPRLYESLAKDPQAFVKVVLCP